MVGCSFYGVNRSLDDAKWCQVVPFLPIGGTTFAGLLVQQHGFQSGQVPERIGQHVVGFVEPCPVTGPFRIECVVRQPVDGVVGLRCADHVTPQLQRRGPLVCLVGLLGERLRCAWPWCGRVAPVIGRRVVGPLLASGVAPLPAVAEPDRQVVADRRRRDAKCTGDLRVAVALPVQRDHCVTAAFACRLANVGSDRHDSFPFLSPRLYPALIALAMARWAGCCSASRATLTHWMAGLTRTPAASRSRFTSGFFATTSWTASSRLRFHRFTLDSWS